MKYKKILILTGIISASCAVLPAGASASVPDYEAAVNAYEQDNKALRSFELEDGEGGAVQAIAQEDTLYVTAREAEIYQKPGENSAELGSVTMGNVVQRVAVCDNGWSKVVFQEDEESVTGYVPDSVLSDENLIAETDDTVKIIQDSDILDYPSLKDGDVVGEVLAQDEVKRTGTVAESWSRITYPDEKGAEQEGFILNDVLEGEKEASETASALGDDEEAGIIHESDGTGIFAEAVEEVTSKSGVKTNEEGVQEGAPVSVSGDASLKPLGTFRITHYCPCSICCGPWSNGITSTGVTAITNHTIAVDPSQIPYGSKVVINDQVYVAEDCGGAIKKNCIDIYVATHPEGQSKGVYYAEVYFLQE